MTSDYLLLAVIIVAAVLLSVQTKKLTWSGSITGGIIGWFIFLGAGFTGIAMIGAFFLLGSLATSWQMNIKENFGTADKNKGRRNAGQVVANGGVAGIAGILSFYFPDQSGLFRLMMAAALASATADTLSSELGTVYGKRFYNILSFKRDLRGENGVVSIEGFLFGIGGSALIAIIYCARFGFTTQFLWILIAGTAGNITDSVLGATLERKHFLNNDSVNFINTLTAAFVALILIKLL